MHNMQQLTLPLARFARERITSADVATLDAALTGLDWMTAAALSDALAWSDRKVRAVAASDARFISYPGSPGYKLLANCTREEYEHFRAATKRQAREMIARVVRADRVWFAHGRAAA